MAQAEEEENHWPGFVDALSTIVMVVTFLLIILAIAIFVMSLQIAKSSAEKEATSVSADTASNVEETEAITVTEEKSEAPKEAAAVRTSEANGRFFLQFSGMTIAVDDVAEQAVTKFVGKTEPTRNNRKYLVVSYFDPSISYTKAQRIAYYRMLAIRGSLSGQGIPMDSIEIFVREAPTLDRIDTVEISITK